MYSFDGVFPEVKNAPEPTVIIWRNLKISNWNRLVRSLIIFIVTICVLVLTIIALVAIKYVQKKYSSEYNVDNCGTISVTMS